MGRRGEDTPFLDGSGPAPFERGPSLDPARHASPRGRQADVYASQLLSGQPQARKAAAA
jgi:hypothetical protein